MRVKRIKHIHLAKSEPVYDVINSGPEHNFVIKGNSCDIVSHNCDHGTFSQSERNFYYIPEGGKIDIVIGSDASHFLGKQIFCVVGDTEILTSDGPKRIQDLAGKRVKLAQYNDHGEIEYHFADVIETKKVQKTARITLDNGCVIEGTPDHKIMLSNGEYKMLKDIQESDDILTFNPNEKR